MAMFTVTMQCETPFPDGAQYTNTARIRFQSADLESALQRFAALFPGSTVTFDFTPDMLIPPADPNDLPPETPGETPAEQEPTE